MALFCMRKRHTITAMVKPNTNTANHRGTMEKIMMRRRTRRGGGEQEIMYLVVTMVMPLSPLLQLLVLT